MRMYILTVIEAALGALDRELFYVYVPNFLPNKIKTNVFPTAEPGASWTILWMYLSSLKVKFKFAWYDSSMF